MSYQYSIHIMTNNIMSEMKMADCKTILRIFGRLFIHKMATNYRLYQHSISMPEREPRFVNWKLIARYCGCIYEMKPINVAEDINSF